MYLGIYDLLFITWLLGVVILILLLMYAVFTAIYNNFLQEQVEELLNRGITWNINKLISSVMKKEGENK